MQPQLHYLQVDLNLTLTVHTLSYQERCAGSVLQKAISLESQAVILILRAVFETLSETRLH